MNLPGACRKLHALRMPAGRHTPAATPPKPTGCLHQFADPNPALWDLPARTPPPAPRPPLQRCAGSGRGGARAPRTRGRESLPHRARPEPHPHRGTTSRPTRYRPGVPGAPSPHPPGSWRPGIAPPPHSPRTPPLPPPERKPGAPPPSWEGKLGSGTGVDRVSAQGAKRVSPGQDGLAQEEREERTLTQDGVQSRQRQEPEKGQGREGRHPCSSCAGGGVSGRGPRSPL